MKKTALALLAGLVLTAPALAQWNGADWGVSPDAALSAVDGATSHDPAAADVFEWQGQQLYPRVRAPITVGDTALTANLLFDDADAFVGVVAMPADAADCPDVAETLAAGYGPGEDFGDNFAAITEWIDSGNALRLTHVAAAGICNLYIAPVAAS
jgi:hypothetical protein